MTGELRVLVVDDALLVREGTRRVLEEQGIVVLGVADDERSMLAALAVHTDVDAIVLDIRMPPSHTDEGLRALESLRARGEAIPVLLLSMYANPSLALRAASAGAGTGYLLKDRITDGGLLADAVRAVARGGTVVDPEVVELLMPADRSRATWADLTPRESEVLVQMTNGMSNVGIADRLHLSVKTVETHVAAIMAKLGIESSPDENRRVIAVLRALRAAG